MNQCDLVIQFMWEGLLLCPAKWFMLKTKGLGFLSYIECPIRYRTRQFFNNFTTNEDIATKSEADLRHCLRNVTPSLHVLEVATICVQTGFNWLIKEMPGSVASGTPCIYCNGFQITQETLSGYLIESNRNAYQIFVGNYVRKRSAGRNWHKWVRNATIQAMYVKRNIEALLCNHFCSGKINEYYIFWVCVCSIRYLAWNAHASYCNL